MATPEQQDGNLDAARAAILAEVEARASHVPPTLRPLTLNAQFPLRQLPIPLDAKLEARVEAGFSPEGHDYPRSRTWSRVVVPAIAVGSIDLVVFAGAGIAAHFHVYLASLITLLSFIALVALGTVACVAAIPALRDPLRLTTSERSELNESRSWRSVQPWIGPPAATPEYRLVSIAREIVLQLAASRAWTSRYLDEHRSRLNLAQELHAIDAQAFQLAQLRTRLAEGTQDHGLQQAWGALVDRVARLRIYADGVISLDEYIARLNAQANAARLEAQVGQLAVGSALDHFAAEHIRSLSADLQHLAATSQPPAGS